MKKTFGRVTLPGESNFLEETKDLLERWGADAIRDSDGTKLDEGIRNLDAKIYTTYFVARGHNEFAEQHMEECQQIYLMSAYTLAAGEDVRIAFAAEYFDQQVTPDYDHDPKQWLSTVPAELWLQQMTGSWIKSIIRLLCIMHSRSMNIPSAFWPISSGIRRRCIITSPMTGVTSLMKYRLMYASPTAGTMLWNI